MQVTSFLFIFSYPSSEWSISIARHYHFLIWCHSSVKWSCLDSSTYLKQALLHRFLSHTKFLSSHLFLIMEREIFTFFYLFFIYSAAAESFKRWVEGESGFFVNSVKFFFSEKCSYGVWNTKLPQSVHISYLNFSYAFFSSVCLVSK